MAHRINQFFRLLEATLQHVFNLMTAASHHAPHHFIIEVLLLALLVQAAMTLLQGAMTLVPALR